MYGVIGSAGYMAAVNIGDAPQSFAGVENLSLHRTRRLARRPLDETHVLMLRLGSSRFQEFAMRDKSKKLSETARALLTAAAARDDHLIQPPQLPAAAARQVVRSLLNAGLAEEGPAPIDNTSYVWRQGDDGCGLMLRATDLGLARIRDLEGSVPALHPAETTVVAGAGTDGTLAPKQLLVGDVPTGEPRAGRDVTKAAPQPEVTPSAAKPSDAVQERPTAPTRPTRQNRLRQAVRALLTAWEESASADALDGHLVALRAALAMEGAASPQTDHPRPSQDPNQARVLALLSRPWSAQEGHGSRDHRAQARRSCVW
jgi:hypothetical protein